MIAVQGVADLTLLLRAMAISKRTPPTDDTHGPIGFEQVTAGAIAYSFYIAAAMMAGVQLQAFLRDHLFDGFAPAALVGFLIYRVPNTRAKFSTIAPLYLLSAAVFGLIAAAAVFSAGKDDFLPPVLSAAVIGGVTLTIPVFTVSEVPAQDDQQRAAVERAYLKGKLDRVRSQAAAAGSNDGADTVPDQAQLPGPAPDAPDSS
jgi:peptidoglycan/LPS O-acetylase OafA/YrhL